MLQYRKGLVNEQQYTNLKDRISLVYEGIYSNMIDSLNHKNTNERPSDKIKHDIKDAYAKGKITERHYRLLIEMISNSE